MTTNEPRRESAGYRGALPTREDRLAKPWLLTVAGIFVLVIVLSIAGIPSRLIPEPTDGPLPSIPVPSVSAEPTEEATPSASPSGSESASEPASPSASPTEAP
jgi:hypothetical protein